MAVNTNRSVWGFHGIPAIIVGFFVLIGILIFLQLAVVVTYRYGVEAAYDEKPIRNIHNLKRIAEMEEQRKFAFQPEKEEEKK